MEKNGKSRWESVLYHPVGIIHSPFTAAKGTPIQPTSAVGVEGTIEIFPQYQDGLKDLDGFSHIILLYHLHKVTKASLQVKPFMDASAHGVFATRAPARPNPIGISIVRLMKIEKNQIYIQDVDILDGTPLLDIKPYLPEFDHREVTSTGWLKQNVHKLPDTNDDGRFSE